MAFPALIFASAFIGCSVYFMYLFLCDRKTMEAHKDYKDELLERIREYNPEFEEKKPPVPANPKDVALSLAGLMIVAIILLAGKGKMALIVSIIFFLIFLGGYIYLDYKEGEGLIESINGLEEKIKDAEPELPEA